MALTPKDLEKIESLVTNTVFRIIHAEFIVFEKRLDEKLEERVKNLPTRDEFYEKMDEIMGELQTTRQEHIVLAGKFEALEEIHPNGNHTFKQ